MKILKIIGILVGIYVGIVVLVESLIGYYQPDMPEAVTIETTDAQGGVSERVLAGFRMDEQLYVAANHWPRDWYNRAIDNPEVGIIRGGQRLPYTAVPLAGEELEKLSQTYDLGFVIRFLTGFPPRRFLRLDPH